ncbi:MAG: sugar phosphate nucleotidyltransferase [Acidimicrobiales bacterium]
MDLDRTLGGFRILHPFTDEDDKTWHTGNAHAIYAHREFVRECDPSHVLVLSADHVYTLDYRDVLDAHLDTGAEVTVVTTEVEGDVSRYGVVQTAGHRITRFEYKPEEPQGHVVATEIFLYDTNVLLDSLEAIVADVGEDELSDFGEQLLPRLVERGKVLAFPLSGYWRDLGTIESYWQGHADLLGTDPKLDLDDPDWPILGQLQQRPAARVLEGARVIDSVLGSGTVIRGTVIRSVVGPGSVIDAGAEVADSVLMDDVVIGPEASVRFAVLGDDTRVERGATVGEGGPAGGITVVSGGSTVEEGSAVSGQEDGAS